MIYHLALIYHLFKKNMKIDQVMDHLSPDLSPITLDFPPPKHPSLGVIKIPE